jgi:hypothetical protein
MSLKEASLTMSKHLKIKMTCVLNKITVITLTLGSRPRQGFVKVQAKSEVQESHFMLPKVQKSVREWTLALSSELPLWGVGISTEPWIFRERLQESKSIGLRSFLFHQKALGTSMFKMGSHDPFGHSKHKLWPKTRTEVKLTIWLSTIKSQESPRFPCVQVACNIPLEISRQWLQFCFRPHLN